MSPAKEQEKVAIDFTKFYNIIDGKPRGTKEVTHSVNPATGEQLWDCPLSTQQDVDDAVKSALDAFPAWSKMPLEERGRLLNKFAEVYTSYENEFLALMEKETGKPRKFALDEIKGATSFITSTTSLKFPEDRSEDDEKTVITRYVPLGVVGAICPWNFPLILSLGKIAPALYAGNTIIVKPSPFTPYSTAKLVEVAQQVFPPGVIQAVGGDNSIGPMLTLHPGISKISFTGSIPTGKKVMEACSKTLKRVTLELGGNDAAIVFPDVDIEKVAPQVALGAFFNSGQVCVATKRIYIHEKIYRPFVEAIVAFTKQALKVGPSEGEGVMLGPVQNPMQFERVKTFFKDSKEQGYNFAMGTKDVDESKGGFFVQPTIIDNPPADSRIVSEEPFGPIVPTIMWSDEEAVIAQANNTRTGLGACVWSKDVEHAMSVGARLEAGNVFINSFEKPQPNAFFSGHKESGIGGEWGAAGLLAYCNAQVMHVYK